MTPEEAESAGGARSRDAGRLVLLMHWAAGGRRMIKGPFLVFFTKTETSVKLTVQSFICTEEKILCHSALTVLTAAAL